MSDQLSTTTPDLDQASEESRSYQERWGWGCERLGWRAALTASAGLVLLTGFDAEVAIAGARSLGMGGTSIAVPDPALTGRDNPAVLGMMRGRGFRMNLFDLNVAAGNNAYSLADYSRYNGATLTEADEDEILSRIAGDGWTLSGEVIGVGPTIAVGPVAVHAQAVGVGGGRIPDEVLELIFDGNPVDEEVDFSEAAGAGWAAAEAGVGIGFGLDDFGRKLLGKGETTFGLRGRYLQGLYYAGIVSADGALVTQADTLYGEGHVELQTASGGSGYALDFGLLHHRQDWNFGLRAEGVVGSIDWTTDPETTIYDVVAATPDFFGDDSNVDPVTSTDSTYAAAAFSTPVPTRLGFGVAHERGPWILAGDLESTVRGRVEGESTLRISAGVERRLSVLRLRLGGGLGGLAGTSVTGGFSFVAGPWRLDLDAGTFSTLNPFASRGLRFGLGSSIVI